MSGPVPPAMKKEFDLFFDTQFLEVRQSTVRMNLSYNVTICSSINEMEDAFSKRVIVQFLYRYFSWIT